jgi:threonylcarbamoyladenosine tRNA methylthiotransferase MtaB
MDTYVILNAHFHNYYFLMSEPKFKIVTLGCRTNQYESQAYADQLKQMGYRPVADGEEADLCIVNSCTVTAAADQQSRYEMRQLARRHPGAKLYVTGCAAEKAADEIKQITGVTAVVSNKEKEFLIASAFPDQDVPEFAISQFDSHTRAFIKVQDGCNSYCTYCIIPYVRGRSRSRTLEEIKREVEGVIANGYKEVVLTGINIGDFDGNRSDGKDTLADLVRLIDGIEGLERLRLSSIDPDEVTDDLADAIMEGRNTCHSLHLVLQSGSNVILKRMNRKYTRQIFLESVNKLRALDPDFTFTTDVIVGFPGETDVDFQETLSVMREAQFVKVHMFPFSVRERTRAALMPNHIPADVIRSRKEALLLAADDIAFQRHADFLGRTMEVLTESADAQRPGTIMGHTRNFLRVSLPQVGIRANELVSVSLVDNQTGGLWGEAVGPACSACQCEDKCASL